jgi:putative spermidine/putrescine transport system ATP-binding protein
LAGKVVGTQPGLVTVETAFGPLLAKANFAVGAPVLLAVRPERIRVGGPGPHALSARLRDAVFQGSKVQLYFEAPHGDRLMAETSDLPHGVPPPGTELKLGWAVADTLIYPAP